MPGMATVTEVKKTSSTQSSTKGESRLYHHKCADNGDGYILDESGVVDYGTGDFTLQVLPDVTESVWNSSESVEEWDTQSGGSEVHSFATGIVTCKYMASGASESAISEDLPPPSVSIQLVSASVDSAIVQGSLQFTAGGHRYVDRAGVLVRDPSPTTGSGDNVGSVDYVGGSVTITDLDGGLTDFAIVSLLTRYGDWLGIDANFRTQVSPIKPEALSVTAVTEDGVQISASANEDGDIVGEWISGKINYQFGTAELQFGKIVLGEWEDRRVDPASIRYNAVAYRYIPLSADILGVDAVRLPSDGRVPIYRAGDLVIVAHTEDAAPATKSNGQTISAGRARLAWVRLIDDNGETVSSERYTLDRVAGTITMTDVSGLAQPLTLRHTIADLRMVTDAQIDGTLTLARGLSHNFPADESIVAGCLLHGDRRARTSVTFDQKTWDGTWKDNIVGDPATATMDFIAHPITVTNEGAETERWCLRWTSSSNVELIGEKRGLVFSGAFNTDIAPINPRTRDESGVGGVPYLTIPLAANGGGWSAGNVVRINTVGAIAPIWIARSISQSEEPDGDGVDGCEIYALGNVDRP